MLNMPARSPLPSAHEAQLLVRLGARLRAARRARGHSAEELAARVGISRTTLWAVERGDPSPTLGTYVRVLSALGLADGLTHLGSPVAAPAASDVPRLDRHGPQDLQSLLLHREAVALLRTNPSLVARLERTLTRWLQRDDPNSRPLLERWCDIVAARDWDAALAEDEQGQQLRQASPLPTVLPEQTRLAVIREVKALKDRARAAA